MPQFGDALKGQNPVSSDLTAGEYRLLADLLLGHIEASNLQDQRLEDLADHLYMLAVQVKHTTAQNTTH